MKPPVERNLGPQPIGPLLERHELKAHDLVSASTDQITHKMISRAVKGRRLNPHVQVKVLRALNAAAGTDYLLGDLFDY